jgi:isopenicillin N synthase-like dioxygenase
MNFRWWNPKMSTAAAKTMADEIPVIDVAPLNDGSTDQVARVGGNIRAAATGIGFFYVKNHGVPQSLINRAERAARQFFDLPPEMKNKAAIDGRHRGYIPIGGANVAHKAAPDAKETFSWGLELPLSDPEVAAGVPLRGPNNWPSFYSELQPALYDYFLASFQCGERLLRAIAVNLGMPPNFFAERYRKPLARGQIIHYPPQAPREANTRIGIGEHTDFGCITLLWQDHNGGLQVLNTNGEWVHAPPIDGTLVINIGDLLQRWSNDRFKSNLHRVYNVSGRDRISMTVFYDPDYSTVVDPRDMALPAGTPVLHEPITAGEHIRSRFDKTFAYRQR